MYPPAYYVSSRFWVASLYHVLHSIASHKSGLVAERLEQTLSVRGIVSRYRLGGPGNLLTQCLQAPAWIFAISYGSPLFLSLSTGTLVDHHIKLLIPIDED